MIVCGCQKRVYACMNVKQKERMRTQIASYAQNNAERSVKCVWYLEMVLCSMEVVVIYGMKFYSFTKALYNMLNYKEQTNKP